MSSFEIPFDVGEIAKTLGGLLAFALVLYVGVIFYKKESSFSNEYILLLEQYKVINEELKDDIDVLKEQREGCESKINENEAKIYALMAQIDKLNVRISSLSDSLCLNSEDCEKFKKLDDSENVL